MSGSRLTRVFGLLVVFGVVAFSAVPPAAARQSVKERFDKKLLDAAEVLEAAISREGNPIPHGLLERARAIVIFPGVVKAGLFFGARYGEGVLVVRDDDGTWSPPAYYTIKGGSWGLQIGAQSMDIVLLVMDREGLRALLKQKFTIGADMHVTAGPQSFNADVEQDVALKGTIYSYTRSRGLFAGVALDGARISPTNRNNHRYYGADYTVDDIVIRRKPEMPSAAKKLIKLLESFSKKSEPATGIVPSSSSRSE